MNDALPRPTIPEVIERFAAYHARPGNGLWGSLHIVLSDGNLSNGNVCFCRDWAIENDDTEGAELAAILLRMSWTQRRKLYAICP